MKRWQGYDGRLRELTSFVFITSGKRRRLGAGSGGTPSRNTVEGGGGSTADSVVEEEALQAFYSGTSRPGSLLSTLGFTISPD